METHTPSGSAIPSVTTLRTVLLFLVTAVLLDVIGYYTVPHRSDFSSNSAFYLTMVEHGARAVTTPFRYRVLVPFLARSLPMSADHALVLITHVSLIGCLLVAMLTCRELGLSIAACLFTALALFCSRAFTYNYLNPYMTDGAALLALFVMVWCYISDKLAAFGVTGVIGILGHEIVVLLVPAILFSRKWKRGAVVCAVCALGFLLTRFWMGAGYSGSLRKEALFFSYHLVHPAEWLKAVVLTWYLLWILLAMGMAMLPAKRMQLLVCTGLLGGGAFVLSLFVLDTERTYSILAPVVAVGAAVVFDRLWKERRGSALCLLTVPLAEFASSQTYRTGTRDLKLLLVCSVPAILCLIYVEMNFLRPSRKWLRKA
jgi:hypothetical protein